MCGVHSENQVLDWTSCDSFPTMKALADCFGQETSLFLHALRALRSPHSVLLTSVYQRCAPFIIHMVHFLSLQKTMRKWEWQWENYKKHTQHQKPGGHDECPRICSPQFLPWISKRAGWQQRQHLIREIDCMRTELVQNPKTKMRLLTGNIFLKKTRLKKSAFLAKMP